jgi:hypothetical protein
MQCYAKLVKNTPVVINERRQKLWACISRGMKGYEISYLFHNLQIYQYYKNDKDGFIPY